MPTYLGAIDQGTSSTRFIVFDEFTRIVAESQVEHAQIYPQPGWVEHDPVEIWRNTQTVISGALPLSSYFSSLKIRWILDHVEGARALPEQGDALFGTLDTFLAWQLTGGGAHGGLHVTDVTNASRTQLMHLDLLEWDEERRRPYYRHPGRGTVRTVRTLRQEQRLVGPAKREPTLLDIGVIAGGFADAAAQDRFCAGVLCYINRIYDQSGKGNDLMQAPPGPLYPGPDKGTFDTQPIADMAPITLGGGHKAYGVYIIPGMGFRNNNARDLPIDDEPAGIHAVVDGEHYSNGCCFNYGNASTNGPAGSPRSWRTRWSRRLSPA